MKKPGLIPWLFYSHFKPCHPFLIQFGYDRLASPFSHVEISLQQQAQSFRRLQEGLNICLAMLLQAIRHLPDESQVLADSVLMSKMLQAAPMCHFWVRKLTRRGSYVFAARILGNQAKALGVIEYPCRVSQTLLARYVLFCAIEDALA